MSPKLLNILLALATFALYYLVINPLWTGAGTVWTPENGIANLRISNAEYTNAINQADTLSQQGKTLQKQYDAVDDATKKQMAVMVPSKIDEIRLLDEVTAIANKTGIAITGLGLSAVTSEKGRGGYDISFGVKTTYPKFKEFMRNYETSLRLFTLQSVSFSAPEKEDDPIFFQIKLRTYYLK